MSNFLELNEAAKLLGVSPEKLVEMRSNGQIRGFRDGASWKFKADEVQRARQELADRSRPAEDDDLGLRDDVDESVLVSEQELGESGEGTSSTIIGPGESADSDLSLAADEGGELSLESASDLGLESGSGMGLDDGPSRMDGGSAIDSDVTLVPGAEGGSDVSLVPDPGSDKEMQAGSGSLASDLDLQSGTGDLSAGADTGGGTGDLDLGLDSELAVSDDDDLVLSGTGSGSDLSLSAADSGINLGSPSDSGLSLEADSGISLQTPTDSGLSLEEDDLQVGGSSISSLELPEDEEVSLDDVGDEAVVQQDEQFMLSPSDEMFADESDSGSQVIALEDSGAFEQDALTGDQALLAETSGLEGQLDMLGGGAPTMAPMGGYPTELPEAPYSVWNILALVVALCFLSVTGILMTDIVRNMWAWEEGRDVSSGIAEGIAKAFGF